MHMLKYIVLLTFLTISCASSEEFIRPGTKLTNYRRIAILPFTDYPVAKGSGIIVADIVSMSLMTSELYVVDRAQTSAILAEQNLGMTGIIDESTAPQVGKMLGVQALLSGSISEWSSTTSNIQVVQGAAPAYLTISTAGITLKITDVNTGQIIWAASARGSEVGDMVQSRAATKAIKNIVSKLLKHYE